MIKSKVSMIVPVYNAEQYLNKCVDSIRSQTYDNLEILLVDDGSKDGSGALCDRYAEEDSRIRVLHKQNGGLVSAWSEGVKHSTGHYLCFVDSDDWIDSDMVERLGSQGTDAPGEILCCGYVIERNDGRQVVDHGLAPGCYEGASLEEVKTKLLGVRPRTVIISRCMKLTSRELIENNMHYCDPRVRMAEDLNIMLPALCDCSRLVILEKAPCYHYYYNTVSMAHAYDRRMMENYRILFPAVDRVVTEKIQQGAPEDLETQWQKEQVQLLLLAVKNELRCGPAGSLKRCRELILSMDLKQKIERYGLKPADRAEQVLFFAASHPTTPGLLIGEGIYRAFDRLFRRA